MQQVVHVVSKRLDISREQSRTVDISVNHKMRWNLRLSQSLLGNPAGHFIEIRSDDQQWMRVQDSASRGSAS